MTSILSFNSTTYVGANMGILKFEHTYSASNLVSPFFILNCQNSNFVQIWGV